MKKNPHKARQYFLGFALLIVIIGFIGMAYWLFNIALSMSKSESPSPTQFFITSLFSVGVFGAILTQIVINAFQWMAMQDSVLQNEKLIKVASDAFEIGEAPHFGIPQIQWIDTGQDCPAIFQISYLNGGKTPAWHFHTLVSLHVYSQGGIMPLGQTVKMTTYDTFTHPGNMRQSFVPAGAEIAMIYELTTIRRLDQFRQIFAQEAGARLDVLAIIAYQDFRGEWQSREFWATGGRGVGEDFEDRTAVKQREDYEKALKERAKQAIAKAFKSRWSNKVVGD